MMKITVVLGKFMLEADVKVAVIAFLRWNSFKCASSVFKLLDCKGKWINQVENSIRYPLDDGIRFLIKHSELIQKQEVLSILNVHESCHEFSQMKCIKKRAFCLLLEPNTLKNLVIIQVILFWQTDRFDLLEKIPDVLARFNIYDEYIYCLVLKVVPC